MPENSQRGTSKGLGSQLEGVSNGQIIKTMKKNIHRIKSSCVVNNLSNLINECSEGGKLLKSKFQLVSLKRMWTRQSPLCRYHINNYIGKKD